MTAQRAYEAEAIDRITAPFRRLATGSQSRPSGISDSDCAEEYRAQEMVAKARALLETALPLTDLRKDEITDLLDRCPDADAWDEAISDAKRDY